MYEEFLERLLTWVRMLNAMDAGVTESETGLTPYLGEIPVMLDGEVCGYLVDEVGGAWSYSEGKR